MALPQIKSKPLTFNEYLNLPDDGNRYELIDGLLYAMAPPLVNHQTLVHYISGQFDTFLQGKPCKVWESPIEVRLFPDKEGKDRHIQYPDITVVCDKNQISKDGKRIEGPPRIIIEVWSPSNEENNSSNLFEKKYWCETAGVKEYWIVYDEHRVHQYLLNDQGIYTETIYFSPNGQEAIAIPVRTFKDAVSITLGSFIFDWASGAIEDYL
ncbi:MAG: Uma2 family endonuclease [Treponema sp.]|jgi:Uma2 family endonuclease|nr:Uma2 family endonuclease [Treponema sp.]